MSTCVKIVCFTGSSKVKKIKVNSRHHQANRRVKAPVIISGKANDGIVEAIESSQHHFVLGLQWHPENMAAQKDTPSMNIFKGFVEACNAQAQTAGMENA
ncbi:gamma-glutamyl-gamma-aminobutyrate hydrolase family protein [Virgibacillus halophilus]|uniref:Gamma-glutamyl-gamma-aminobutyrate hydrolase family protein n=1 Tax=Tigheibacillus halophilus TaxID=361280 RepID=A0ABU5C1Y2_9BACI|nr:gamma-glutamyl-gamma-aminobutyrate hydrolase family protein [Virgibacillus halophilus]